MKTALFRKNPKHAGVLALDPRAVAVEFSVDEPRDNENCDSVAVVSICGPLEHHASYMWDSYDAILNRLETAFQNEEVKAVIMCIDSPGGDAAGATEAHRKIKRLRKQYDKPLFAYSNESMYSAAYSIGSAADEIWVPETGGVGSVGVICMLLDKTKQNEMLGLNVRLLTSGARKADSHADRELTDDVVDAMQSRVDYLADVFFRCVAKARSMTPKAVAKLQAGIFMGQSAVDSGLADGVAGWYKFLQYVSTKIESSVGSAENENVESSNQGKAAAKEHANMKTIAQLKKERDLAEKKLAGARSQTEHKKLFAAFEETIKNLAAAEISAKTKYVKKTEERLTKDDSDEDDEDDDTDESAEEEESEESEEDDDDSDAEESDDSSAEQHASAAPSNFSKKSVDKLFSIASKLTGCSEPSEVLGALEGMMPRIRKLPEVERRVAKLETNSRKSRVKSMLDKAKSEGRITPAQAKGLESQGLKDPSWLKGYLSSQPPVVRSIDDVDVPDFNASAPNLDQQNLSADQKKMIQLAAQSAGMSVEDYTKEIEKTRSAKNTNGAVAPRY